MHINLEGLDLAATKFLLVKFYFTNKDHIPAGITQIERKAESELIKQRMERIKAATPADTRGVQIVDNALNTSASMLFSALRREGMVLLDIQSWEQTKKGRPTKYVVNFVWGLPQEGIDEIEVDTTAFTENVVWFCHVWQNPTDVNTVDFVGRQPGQKAKHLATVEDGHLVVNPA